MRTKSTPIWLALGAIAFVVGCAAGIQFTQDKLQDPGQILFNGYTNKSLDCYHCHNGDGRGSGRGPDLSKSVPKMPEEALRKVILEGSGFMPAFKDSIQPAELDQILAWLKKAFGAPEAQEIEAEAVETGDG